MVQIASLASTLIIGRFDDKDPVTSEGLTLCTKTSLVYRKILKSKGV
jgi:hypothetical protein